MLMHYYAYIIHYRSPSNMVLSLTVIKECSTNMGQINGAIQLLPPNLYQVLHCQNHTVSFLCSFKISKQNRPRYLPFILIFNLSATLCIILWINVLFGAYQTYRSEFPNFSLWSATFSTSLGSSSSMLNGSNSLSSIMREVWTGICISRSNIMQMTGIITIQAACFGRLTCINMFFHSKTRSWFSAMLLCYATVLILGSRTYCRRNWRCFLTAYLVILHPKTGTIA